MSLTEFCDRNLIQKEALVQKNNLTNFSSCTDCVSRRPILFENFIVTNEILIDEFSDIALTHDPKIEFSKTYLMSPEIGLAHDPEIF